jgi:DNA-binding GntR family transcriptional regulator
VTSVAADEPRSRRLGPVTTPTLVESVAEAIRESILSGRFAPGDRLVEAELARELHVSRGPIREALGLLGKDGIVVHEPRRGKFVQALTPRLIDEVYSLRLLLEPFAAERVIEQLDDEGRGQLKAALANIAEAASAGDERLLAQADVAFHDLLYELADHDLLQRAWLENIAGKLRLVSNITTRSLAELEDAERNHRRLLEPILAGDVATARRRIEEHISDARPLARAESQLLTADDGVG